MNNAKKELERFLSSTLKMSDLSQVAVYSESSDIYKVSVTIVDRPGSSVDSEIMTVKRISLKNVFCNPAFELEGEREERVEGFRTAASTPEPTKPAVSRESSGPLTGTANSFNLHVS